MSCPAYASVLDPVIPTGAIDIPRGPNGSAGRRYTLTILQPDGSPQDCTTATVTFEITGQYSTSVLKYSLDNAGVGGITFATPSNGVGILTIPSGAFSDRTQWVRGSSWAWRIWIDLSGDTAAPYDQFAGVLRIVDVA